MLGKLVTSNPSTWAAVSPSKSATSRRWRGSDTRGERPSQPAKRELITISPQSTHDANRRLREHRVSSFRLAGVHVGHVHFDERNRDGCKGVADRYVGVRVRTGVDDYAVHSPAKLVDGIDYFAFAVVLREFDVRADFPGHRSQGTLHIGE